MRIFTSSFTVSTVFYHFTLPEHSHFIRTLSFSTDTALSTFVLPFHHLQILASLFAPSSALFCLLFAVGLNLFECHNPTRILLLCCFVLLVQKVQN